MCVACEFKLRPNVSDDDGAHLKVQRYDRLESRYITTGDFSALQEMSTEYPIETRTLIEKMLQLGKVDDSSMNTKFLRLFQDSTLQALVSDVEAEYANMDDINEQLSHAFKNLREWIPSIPVPKFYAQIGALDQSIIVGDNSIGISLDKYMGKDYPLYKKYYSDVDVMTMTRNYIVPDCITFYLLSLYPIENYESLTQQERDLHMAKVMWVTNKAIGKNVFENKYIKQVDNFMKSNAKESIASMLMNNDIKF